MWKRNTMSILSRLIPRAGYMYIFNEHLSLFTGDLRWHLCTTYASLKLIRVWCIQTPGCTFMCFWTASPHSIHLHWSSLAVDIEVPPARRNGNGQERPLTEQGSSKMSPSNLMTSRLAAQDICEKKFIRKIQIANIQCTRIRISITGRGCLI
jgi:hypothetical protein